MMALSRFLFWDGLLSAITPELCKKLIVAQEFFERALVGVRSNRARIVTAQAVEFHGLSAVLTVLKLLILTYFTCSKISLVQVAYSSDS